MPISRKYVCPSCEGSFTFMHHPVDEPPPRFCPLCAYDSHSADVVEFAAAIVAPHVKNRVIVQAVDQTYRQMEAGAEHQIQEAARMTGLDASEFANMKITDMKDNLREGDVAAVPVNNVVSQAMAAAPNLTGFQNQNALGYAAAAHVGSDAHAGAKTASMLRQAHAAKHGNAVHEVPTAETLKRGSGTTF